MPPSQKSVQGHASINRLTGMASNVTLIDKDGGLDETKLTIKKITDEAQNDWTSSKNKVLKSKPPKKTRLWLRIVTPGGLLIKDVDPPDTGTLTITITDGSNDTTVPVAVNYVNDDGT